MDTQETAAATRDPARGPAGSWSDFGVIFACFLLSGATGLIYQVIWLRLLGLVFGHTVYAITTVLATFMAGLALGSFLFARRAGRLRNPVATYGWLEIAIAAACALVPLLLRASAWIYVALHGALDLSYDAFSLLQFALAFLALLVPTTLMGGTLPVLSQALVKQDVGVGRKVGALYSVNTFGAVVGVVLAGYVLLPALGNHVTIAIAVAGNFVVGVLALVYSRRGAGARGPEQARGGPGRRRGEERPAPAGPARPLPAGARLTVLALGVSGAVSMVYEICWTRAISLVIGGSTYAFTAMLVAFLVGIAGGSALYSWGWGHRRPSAAAFGMLQVGIGATTGVTMLLFERAPELFLAALRISEAPSFIQLVHFVVSAAALLPVTLLIGATFPCAVAVATRGAARIGRDVGEIYAVNTVGAIAGSVATGFALIPAFGVNTSIKIGIAINLVLAAVLLAPALWPAPHPGPGGRPWRWGPAAVALAAALGVFLLPAWDQRVMSSGPAVYARQYLDDAERRDLASVLRDQEILFYRDGRSGTVSVNRAGPHLFLRVNGKMDAGTAVDMPTQLMSGHLPVLLHRQPARVLVIGMGSGITAGAVLRHPVERLDIVEIEPAVLEASRFFAEIHGDVLRDPRVRAIVADGRNYLATTSEQYDVIISEPSNPWLGGLASLFSVEFFGLARRHLRPGGLMLQWLQGYNLYREDFRMIVNTYRSVFPEVAIWNTIRGDYLLVGSTEPLLVDLSLVKERHEQIAGLREDLARLELAGWAAALGYFMLGGPDVARFAEGAGLNTDSRLPLEFSAPRALHADTTGANWTLVRSFQTAMVPAVTPESEGELRRAGPWHAMAMNRMGRGHHEDALLLLDRALQIEPGHPAALAAVGLAQLRLGKPGTARETAQEALRADPRSADALRVAGLASETLGRHRDAVGFYERAIAVEPGSSEFRTALERARRAAGL